MNIFSLIFIFCLTIQISSSSFEFKPIRNNNLKMKNESKNNKIIKSNLKTSTQLNNKSVKIMKIKNPKKYNNKLPEKAQLQRGYTRILYSFG